MTFLGGFWASCGRIWMKIGGNSTRNLPGPSYPPQNPRFLLENLENKPEKFQKIPPKYFLTVVFFNLLNPVQDFLSDQTI